MASKTLNFYATSLKQDTTVILIFEPFPYLDLYRVKFPVVWKVIKFRARAHAKATVTYPPCFAFGHAQTDDNNLVEVAKWVELQSPDTVPTTGENEGKQSDGTSERRDTKVLVCKSETNQPADLSIGLIKVDADGEHFEPVLLCRGVRANSNVTTQFTPMLSAYVTRDYEKSQYLRGEVENDTIWVQNLNLLEECTSWSFRDDEETGYFSIERT